MGHYSVILMRTYLDITRPPIKVQMQVFDFAVFRKLVRNIFFSSFLMDIGDEYYPPFDRCRYETERG
jgi:hypothetical protein